LPGSHAKIYFALYLMQPALFCSTIIPTVGRPSLDRAVLSVLNQEGSGAADFEVIVVNDSGRPLPEADWRQSPQVRLIETNRRNRSVARNAGAAIANGRYLHFLDDDDYLLPHAFRALRQVAQENPDAAWLYGGYKLVDREEAPLETCHPDEQGNCAVRFAIGEWLPLQISLIRTDAFFAVGGFASLESLLGGDEDVDLSRQISLTHDIAGTPEPLGVILFGHAGNTTTNYATLRQQSRISREKMLAAPGAARRMLESARSRFAYVNYWQGRVVWCYLASVYWNARHGRPLTAVSRLLSSSYFFAQSGRHIFSRYFWRGAAGRQLIHGWLSTGK
jgi:glycosyltransferase involved in cell wall biosynthesis